MRIVARSGRCLLIAGLSVALGWAMMTAAPVAAQESAVGPFMKLLQSGRLPAERQGAVVEMIVRRGNERDLQFIFDQLQKPDGFSPALRQQVLQWLTDAAATRKVVPAGDLSALGKLIQDDATRRDPALLQAALRLASVWKVKSISADLRELATSEQSSDELRRVAIEGLVTISDENSRTTLDQLAVEGKTPGFRMLAVAGLTRMDVAAAARHAAEVLRSLTPQDDPAPMIDALLNRQGGADQLAAALAKNEPPADAAKMALRHMYSVGRSDQALSDVLSRAAGIATDTPPPTQEEVAKIVAEVNAKGNAARGEKVFRRADVNCLKCHAVSHAGGNVGPELSAVGSISPVDYVVNSILNPNLAIKEQYVTKVVLTVDGEIFTGIVVDRDDDRVNLRDASGKVITIPTADIDVERDGQSLMPQGLTKFLTHDELLDLAKFVAQLGKPGPYAIRTTPTIQRWRVLKSPGLELTAESPNVEMLRQFVLDAPPESWAPAYGMVNGTLPLAELRPLAVKGIVYLQGAIEVTEPGQIAFQIDSTEPTHVWIDAEPFESQKQIERNLPTGRHKVTLRVNLSSSGPDAGLKVEITKPSGSSAQFTPVHGA